MEIGTAQTLEVKRESSSQESREQTCYLRTRAGSSSLGISLIQYQRCTSYHTDYVIKELFTRNKYKPDLKFPLVEMLKYLLWVFSYHFFYVVTEVFCLCVDQGNREPGKEGRAPNGKEGFNNNKKFWPPATCTW